MAAAVYWAIQELTVKTGMEQISYPRTLYGRQNWSENSYSTWVIPMQYNETYFSPVFCFFILFFSSLSMTSMCINSFIMLHD